MGRVIYLLTDLAICFFSLLEAQPFLVKWLITWVCMTVVVWVWGKAMAGTCGVERKGFIFLQLEYFQIIIATSTEFSVKLTRSLARLMIDSPTTTRRMMVSMEGDQNTRHGVIGLSVWV